MRIIIIAMVFFIIAIKESIKNHYYDFLNPINWTYFYDHSALAKTLDKYIDYKKLNLAATKEELPESTSTYNNCCRCDDSQTTYI